MLNNLVKSISVAVLLGGAILIVPAVAGVEGSPARPIVTAQAAQGQDLQPFTHFARIPAGSDPATIRFEKIRAVSVPVSVRYTTDAAYCRDLAFRDPGGSLYCPEAHISTAPAVEVTYSYSRAPLGSDEYRDSRSAFSVYFRADELSPELRAALAGGKHKGMNLAEYFLLNTHVERVPRVVIDEGNSTFCDGNYTEGNWTHTDPACRDQVAYRTADVLSGYLTVKVDPASRLSAHAR